MDHVLGSDADASLPDSATSVLKVREAILVEQERAPWCERARRWAWR